MFQAQSGSGSGLTVLLLQMVAIGLVFYFLILRPSGQARKRHAEMLSNLKKGDEIMTSGGIIGKVKDIKEVEADGGRRPGSRWSQALPSSWWSAPASCGSAESPPKGRRDHEPSAASLAGLAGPPATQRGDR